MLIGNAFQHFLVSFFIFLLRRFEKQRSQCSYKDCQNSF